MPSHTVVEIDEGCRKNSTIMLYVVAHTVPCAIGRLNCPSGQAYPSFISGFNIGYDEI